MNISFNTTYHEYELLVAQYTYACTLSCTRVQNVFECSKLSIRKRHKQDIRLSATCFVTPAVIDSLKSTQPRMHECMCTKIMYNVILR